jgi:membrane peptidoglycan carboxypeptidase
MMLDMKRTFDEVIDRHAQTRRASRIKSNRFYQQLSDTLAGTQEYMAMEKLYDLHQLAGTYDCIVIDTPPTRNALDFLDAPKRLTDFLEGRFLRMFLPPGCGGRTRRRAVAAFGTGLFMRRRRRSPVPGSSTTSPSSSSPSRACTRLQGPGAGRLPPPRQPRRPRSWSWPARAAGAAGGALLPPASGAGRDADRRPGREPRDAAGATRPSGRVEGTGVRPYPRGDGPAPAARRPPQPATMPSTPSRSRASRRTAPRTDLGGAGPRLLAIPFLIVGAALLLGATLAPAAGWAATAVRTIDASLLNYPPIPEDLRELSERSVILDRDGNRLAIIRDENRKIVGLDEIPEHVRQAVIATEDQEFYTHEGVNWRSVVRAAFGNVRAGEVTSGASTLTQQLVKNLILESAEQTIDRKLQEAVYALELEKRMSKDEILEAYLNTAYFANGTYGVAAAAEFYWGKTPADLTVDEAALLAGLLRAPERNDPVDHPDNAIARRNIVLRQMATVGFLSQGEADRLAATELVLDVRGRSTDGAAVTVEGGDYITTYVIEQLKKDPALGDHPDPDEAARLRFRALATGGYTIHTTIDPRLQEAAQAAIRSKLSPDADPLGALTSVDPRTGEILAIGFGPRPFGTGDGEVDVNPAVPDLGSDLGRQSGSAFKTFGLVAALEAGVSPAYTMDTPSPYVPTGACSRTSRPWRPGNYSDGGGGVMDMARATAVSSNVYFAHLVDELVSPDDVRDVAVRLGLRNSKLEAVCASILGTDGTYPVDMAAAFGALGNRGIACETHVVARVVDRSGNTVSRGGERCNRAVDEGVAARATALLRGPIENGTASRNGRIGRPAAGKTGTTQGHRDAWFVGYVPQLSTAVWVGRESGDDPLTHPDCPRGMTGGCVPTSIWSAFMTEALRILELPVEQFPTPPPLPSSQVPSVVGMPQEAAEQAIEEASFRPVVEIVAHHRPAGEVVEQSPGGGATAPTGSAVRLSVSDGTGEPPRMPDLAGLTEAEAIERLRALDLGLTVDVREVPVDDLGAIGAVVGQRPAPGAELEADATVVLEVGRQRGPEDGPPPTAEPTDEPTERPSPSPSPSPTAQPSPAPTQEPQPQPTEDDGQGGGQGQGQDDDPGAGGGVSQGGG